MRLLTRRKRSIEPAAPQRIDLIPGVPEASLGRCYRCGTSWKWVHELEDVDGKLNSDLLREQDDREEARYGHRSDSDGPEALGLIFRS